MRVLRRVIRLIVPLPLRKQVVKWRFKLEQYATNPLLHQMARMIAKYADPAKAFAAFQPYDRYLIVKNYIAPIPDENDIAYANRESELIGIEIDEAKIFEFLDHTVHPYKQEFNAFPIHSDGDPFQFHLANEFFMAVDGNVYYGLIRHHKPRKIIEIGSGFSTLLASAAIQKNVAEGGHTSLLTCVEPYPRSFLREGTPERFNLIEKPVQAVDLSTFESLEPGDILFIDSSHVLRAGNDVWWEYCEILPRLKPGVWVHIHDISLPLPYSPVYYQRQAFWNEQYVLQAFLAHNPRFEVVWPGVYMYHKHRARMDDYFQPEFDQMNSAYPGAGAASFWMRVKEG